MKHKLSKLILLTTALCALLTLTAFAAEGEDEAETVITSVTTVEELPDYYNAAQASSATSASLDSWTGASYKDQLTGYALLFYEALENAIPSSELTTVETNSGSFQGVGFVQDLVTFKMEDATDQELSDKINEEEAVYGSSPEEAWYAFTYDHPEYFWIRTNGTYNVLYSIRTLTYTNSATGVVTKIEYEITLKASIYYRVTDEYTDKDTRDKYDADIESVARDILEKCADLPTVAQLAYFDNWLAENDNYNNDAANDSSYIDRDSTPWNLIGGLLNGYSPVCEGYAKSFKYLCDLAEIPCITISGKAYSSNGSGGDHMWNAVELDGVWYMVDTTWDDPVYTTGKTDTFSTRNYFLCDLKGDHTPDTTFTTPTVSGNNYFADWTKDKSAFLGSKSSNGAYWVALYAENGQMISCQKCQTFDWDTHGENALYICNFDSSVLSAAATAKQFYLNTTTWAPITT
jgi:hypothetical protein